MTWTNSAGFTILHFYVKFNVKIVTDSHQSVKHPGI